MKTPLYFPNERIIDGFTGRPGRIVEVINADDPQDVKTQGFRYYVLVDRQLFSLSEKSIFTPSEYKYLQRSKATL